MDMYGQKWDHVTLDHQVTCTICRRAISATRFAPHLAKCMGLGGRLASRHAKRHHLPNLTNNSTNSVNAQTNSAHATFTSSFASMPSLMDTSAKDNNAQTLILDDAMPSDPDDCLFDFYASMDYSSDDNALFDKSNCCSSVCL
jgi:Sgf11 (transcriptional regulation protein)